MKSNKKMKSYSAVCFDAFGTLISYGDHPTNPYRYLAHAEGNERIKRRDFLTRNVSVEVFARELAVSDLLPTILRELAEEVASLRLYPEVELVMHKLRAKGKKIGVCSNLASGYGKAVRQLLPNLDSYVLSYEIGHVKPEPLIFNEVCKSLNCYPDEVLFVGDSKRCDYFGPKAFGMQSQWLDRKNGQTLLDMLA